jgi:chromate transport protein ChrA
MDGRAIRAVIAGCVSAALVAGVEIGKRHYAAHRVSGRIVGGVLLWLVLTLAALAILTAVAWLARRVRGDDGALPGGVVAWVVALVVAAPWFVSLGNKHTHSWKTGQIVTQVIAGLIFALAIRVVLLLGEALWRHGQRPRN